MDTLYVDIMVVILGYVIGSLLPAYFITKVKGFDIREHGTGNPGISNAADTMGYTVAVGIAFWDLFKAPLAILLSRELGTSWVVSYLAGLAVFVGHRMPFYLRFRGGEGLATAVSIGFFSLGMLVTLDPRLAYLLIPVIGIMALIFFMRIKQKPAIEMTFFFVPILLNGAVLINGWNVHTVVLGIACLFIIGHRIAKLVMARIQFMSPDERHLLKRKWLRPLAIVFPLGALFIKAITLVLVTTVFVVFVLIEIIRFRTKRRRFPVPYKKSEESRISSMVMFLFATVLVLWFFPTNIASLAIMFVVFGDLLAWCIGITVGGRPLLNKTVSGTLACLVTCLTLVIVYHSLDLIALRAGVLGALSATAVELAPMQEDNFVMPMASAIVMTIL